MKKTKALFVGMYPNEVDKYRNVFFRNLIFAMADSGVECSVISPVSYTHYKNTISKIPLSDSQISPGGNEIKVYYPRYVSFSSKKIGPLNTMHITESAFQKTALKKAKSLGMNFDFVYGHFFLMGGLAAVRIGNALNIPSFIAYGESSFEGMIRSRYGSLKPSHIKGLSGVIAVSTKNANELKAEKIFDEIPMKVFPNATDKSKFYVKDKHECRRELGIPEDKFVIGFVGSFIDRKGDKRILEAIEGLEGVYGAFVGRGDNPPAGEKVLFCKALEHQEVCTFLNAIDVFCLPTLSEGSCNAVVEAMSCGKAIVSSDLPFNYDALNSENSVLVNPNSVDEIQNAIRNLYEDEALRKRISEKSLLDSDKFTIEKRAENILKFIKENS